MVDKLYIREPALVMIQAVVSGGESFPAEWRGSMTEKGANILKRLS
jgi:hypothetical protein